MPGTPYTYMYGGDPFFCALPLDNDYTRVEELNAALAVFEAIADQAANRIREEVDSNANIIFGATFDEKLAGKIRISVVATGIESSSGGSAIGGGGFGNSVVSTLRPAAATAVPNAPVANQATPSSASNSSRVYNKANN